MEKVRERRIPAVAAWYLVSAWAVIQVADVVGPPLDWPKPTVRYLIYAAVVFLPITLVASWFLRVAPTGRKIAPVRKVVEGRPLNAAAYEAYQRANHLATQTQRWHEAVAAYRECIAHDPKFAPAWARMARCYRLIAKYTAAGETGDENLKQAVACFDKALMLQPELPLTHSLYAQLEIDTGKPEDAMVRLLARADVAGADAEIYAGLVQALRFLGMLDESVVAHERARALDPNVRTGVTHTYFMLGRYEDALAQYRNADIGYLEGIALAMLGRSEEAITLLRMRETGGSILGPYLSSLRALLEGDRTTAMDLMAQATTATLSRDGEAMFYLARQYAHLGAQDEAIAALQHAIKQGFVCHARFQSDPWLDSLRESGSFRGAMRAAETRHRQARETFIAANGAEIIGKLPA